MALNHTVQGSVNYTVVGTPTIVDGVVSGFDSSNYLTLPYVGDTLPQEYVFTFTTGSDITSTQTVFNNFTCRVQISSGVINCFMRMGYNVNITKTSSSISANTKYTVKISMTASGVGMYYKTADSGYVTIYEGSEVAVPVSSNMYIGHYDLTAQSFLGSIDLNSTYIKVDAQAWFGVCPVEVKHINYGTNVGYTVVGNPTIVNGVLLPSDKTTNTNYIKIVGNINLNNDYEIQYKFKLSSGAKSATYPFPLQGTSTGYMNVNYNPSLSGKPILFLVYPAGASWNTLTSTNFTFEEEVDYWIRIVKNSNNYKLYISTDGSNFALNNEVTFSGLPSNLPTINQLTIGYSSTSNRFLLGSIDLNQTYIKVNGKLWFYHPATNYLVKDNKLIFADSGLYIEENGVKTYATQNIAPVPSGYTYGNTTTSAIGWVDMRTQQFTAAPAGATLGKDE